MIVVVTVSVTVNVVVSVTVSVIVCVIVSVIVVNMMQKSAVDNKFINTVYNIT